MNQRKPSLSVIVATALLATAGTAYAGLGWAAEREGPKMPMSVADLEARAKEHFARIDTDGDGKITAEEFDAAEMPRRGHGGKPRGEGKHGAGPDMPPMHHHWVESSQGDRAKEQEQMETATFNALDADADGKLSRTEFDLAKLHEAHQKAMRAGMFGRLDSDGDGTLTETEFGAHMNRVKALDTNVDGEISRDEFRSGRQARNSTAP